MSVFQNCLYCDFKSPAAIISMLFFALCVPFRILGYREHFSLPIYLITQVILPTACAVLMIATIILFGKTALWVTVFPLTLGVLSFVFKLFLDPRYTGLLHHIACAILYSMIVVLWLLTIFNVIKTKWILVGLFAIPLLIHIFGEDLPVLLGKTPPISSAMWLKEFSMLSIMLALVFLSASFMKR